MSHYSSVTDSLLGNNSKTQNNKPSYYTSSTCTSSNDTTNSHSPIEISTVGTASIGTVSPNSAKVPPPSSVTQHTTGSSSSTSTSTSVVSLGGLISCTSTSTHYENDDLLSIAPSSKSSLSLTSINDTNSSTNHSLQRHLTLLDLISIGVAATVGSGIFVLCGLIAHDYAGPSTFLCWGIAGLSCCASGLCYAELSGKFAVSGSTYSYVQITMGEIPAVAAGACITLEYIVASSAVARSWGDKVVAFIIAYIDDDSHFIMKYLQPGYGFNPMAFLISVSSVTLLLKGVKESKQATNLFTLLKVSLIAFMSIASLSLMDTNNLFPLLPAKFGIAGILRGSTSSFFGYIGFDEICCMGGEVVDPVKNLPRAVMGTIGLVTVLYVIAAIGLVGMVPYQYISETSGFPDGFRYRGYDTISQITALGEIVTLPIVVMVTTMAQPRLQYAMAQDGLLPAIFAKVDASGNLWHGTFIAGVVMVIVATCVPFSYLNDLISAGVLMAFSMTAASVVLLRHKSPRNQPLLLQKSLVKFNFLSLTMGLLIQQGEADLTGQLLPLVNLLMLIALAMKIGTMCPVNSANDQYAVGYFQMPLVPYLPLLAQFLNWYLIGQLGLLSVMLLIGYVGLALIIYYIFKGRHNHNHTHSDKTMVGGYCNVKKEIGCDSSSLCSSRSQLSMTPMMTEAINI